MSTYVFFIVDGLEYTRNWLLKYVNADQAVSEDVEYELFVRGVLKRAFVQACVDLLDWPENTPYPEVSIVCINFYGVVNFP